MAAQRRQVVAVQVRIEPEAGRRPGEQLEHRALVAGDARHPQGGGGVADERLGV